MRRDRSNYLFNRHSLFAVIEGQKQALAEGIKQLSNSQIQNTEESQLATSLRNKYRLDPIVISEENIEVEQNDSKIDVSHDTMRLSFGPGPHEVDGFEFTYHIPFGGDPDLLYCQPSRFSSMTPYAEVEGNTLVIRIETEDPEGQPPDSQFEGELNRIKQYSGYVNDDISAFNNELDNRISEGIRARKETLQKVNASLAGSKYRIRTSPGAPTTYPTTAVERRTPIEVTTVKVGQKPVPVLSESQYEHIIGVIKSVANTIERTHKTYANMGEEELRDIFLAHLNGHYSGKATAEAFNSNGKTDILIRDQDKNIFIAECKIWGGGKTFTDSIDQLLGYTSWRDTKTALIYFNRNKDLTAVLEQIPELVKGHSNFKRELSKIDETDFRFVLHHNDDEAQELFLAVLVVELPA